MAATSNVARFLLNISRISPRSIFLAVVVVLCMPLPASTASPELPRAYVDTTYNPPSGGTTHQVKTACGGSENNCFTQLQSALDQAQPGDIVELQAGATFPGRYYIRPKTGNGWIYIRNSRHTELPQPGTRVTEAHRLLMAKIEGVGAGANGRALEISTGVNNVRITGIEITSSYDSTEFTVSNLVVLGLRQDNSWPTSVNELPNNIIFDRVDIHGSPNGNIRNGILLDGRNVAVIDSRISGIKAGSESHTMITYNGAGPFKIVNNYLEATGVNTMYGGMDPSIPNLVPADIEFRYNHFTKDLSWRGDRRWLLKNLFELKNARRVLVNGNILEYSWQAAQTGDAVVIKSTNQNNSTGCPWCVSEDITFTNNIVRHAAGGIRISGRDSGAPFGGQTSRILIKNNLLYDIDASNWGSAGRPFTLAEDHRDIHLVHNTAIASGNSSSLSMGGGTPASGFAVENCIISRNIYGVKGDGQVEGINSLTTYAPGYVFRRNAIVEAPSSLYPLDNFFPTALSVVQFIDPEQDNYKLASTSPYKRAGTDGKDLGVDMTALLEATSCVVNGNCRSQPPETIPPAAPNNLRTP